MSQAIAFVRTWVIITFCVLVAACSSVPKSPSMVAEGSVSRDGRFAITVTEPDGQQQAVQGGFNWSDDGRRYRLDLLSPLGSVQARVEGHPGYATLTKADGSVYEADNPDALAEAVLGGPIPVSYLRDWIRGRLDPAAVTDLKRDELDRPTAFVQDDWQVRLSRYDSKGPGLLILQRAEPGRRIMVRLAVDQS
jgi:outer membrane lipoprotein LolB